VSSLSGWTSTVCNLWVIPRETSFVRNLIQIVSDIKRVERVAESTAVELGEEPVLSKPTGPVGATVSVRHVRVVGRPPVAVAVGDAAAHLVAEDAADRCGMVCLNDGHVDIIGRPSVFLS
jgi:hypothetical protein